MPMTPDVIWTWVFFHFSTFSLCHNIRATHAPLHCNPEAAVAFYRDARPLSFFRPEYGDGEVGGGRGRDFNGGRRARARASVSASATEEKQSFTVDANLKFQNPFCLPSLQTAAARRLLHPATFPQLETAVQLSAQRQEIRVSLTTRNGGRVSSERVFNNPLCSFFIISIAERLTKGVGMGGYGFYTFLRRISLL